MMFLNRICTICLFILLTTYNVDSYKWRTKELGDDINFPLNYSSLTRLVDPLSSKIFLQMPFAEVNVTFSGDSETLIIVNYPITQIRLNAYELTIKKETFLQKHIFRYPYKDEHRLRDIFYLNETETLVLDFETEILSGFYQINMEFIGNINENETGLYRTICKDCTEALGDKHEMGKDCWIFMTQLKPAAARRVFPCWDEPAFRTRFAIGIEHHRNYTILSNMPIRSNYNVKGDRKHTHFESTPPIPSHLVAFSLMDSVCSTIKEIDLTTRVCSPPLVKQERMTYALNISANIIAYLMWYMRISPRYPEITHIGLPNFSYGTAENWGLNIYRLNHLIYKEALYPIERKLDVSMYVSSTVALQWVGNLVSPTSWTHMWFNQALALFYGVKAFTKIYNDEDVTSLFTYRLQSLARENHVVSQVKPVMYSADNRDESDKLIRSSHFTNCLKEYAIIAMLEYSITESVFQDAIIKYLEKYQFSTATPNDFWDILQDMIEGIEVFRIHTSIAQIVQNWLKQRSLPVITVTRSQIDDYVIIRQEHMSTEDDDNNNNDLLIPVNYIAKLNAENGIGIVWLDAHKQINVSGIFIYDWIVVNWQYTGYYRVQYDTISLQILAMCLTYEERTKINVLNRAHIIEDAYYFWTEEKLHFNNFINLIRFMSNEEECAPWYALQNIIEKMWPFLNMDIGTRAKSVLVDVLAHLFHTVGYTEHRNDTGCMKFKRLLAMKWTCRLSYLPCLVIAKERLHAHLQQHYVINISPMWKEWTYCNGLVLSKSWAWTRTLTEYMSTRNRKILKYLVCSEDILTIRGYLELAMTNNSIIPDVFVVNSEDRQNIYHWIIKRHISKNEVLDYVLEQIVKMKIE